MVTFAALYMGFPRDVGRVICSCPGGSAGALRISVHIARYWFWTDEVTREVKQGFEGLEECDPK